MSNNAAGIVSIGHLGTTELAAAALSNMTANVSGFAMLAGFVGALDTVLPPVYSSNPRTMGIWAQRMMLLIGVLLLPVLAVWLNTERLLLLLGQDAEVSALAGRYLQILSLGLPAYAGFEIARRYLQAEGFFFAPTLVLLVTTPLNIALQIILVPRIGFIGAPIAIVAFLWASLLLGALQICFFSRVEWSGWSAAAFRDLGPLARIGAASSISVGLEWWSWEVSSSASQISCVSAHRSIRAQIVALLTSRLGTFALAAQSVSTAC
jgi:MATE family multidrug resistance protein